MPFILFLPTYTATAWYHNKLSEDLQHGDLEIAVQEARDFAMGAYSLALMKGNDLKEDEQDKIIVIGLL